MRGFLTSLTGFLGLALLVAAFVYWLIVFA